MKIIGLTGGIGSGKTTVAKEFKKLGVPIFIADDASKYLLQSNEDVIKSVQLLLGKNSYFINDQGQLLPDKKFIASQVFSNQDLLNSLNSIMHPAVKNYFDSWFLNQKSSYIIYEAAILFESGGHHRCNDVILVTVSMEERFKRIMKRDDSNRDDVRKRMEKQWTDIQRLELSDFVIKNENRQDLSSFVKSVHDVLLKN